MIRTADTFFALGNKYRRLILYGLIGLSALGLELAVFAVLTGSLQVEIAAGNALAMLAGLLFSFALNSQYNFRVYDYRAIRLLRYIIVTIFGYVLSTVIILGCIELFKIAPAQAKFVSLPAFFLFQYTCHHYFTFRADLIVSKTETVS